MTSFVAVDVETANADFASVCQVGVVVFEQGAITDRWASLVDPEDVFDRMHVSIHGIDEATVIGAPTFPAVYDRLSSMFAGKVVVCHTAFDRAALNRTAEKYELRPFECQWLDSARVVRRAWAKYAKSGYGLASVAADLQIHFHHHDAAEDARAAGEILLQAISHTGETVEGWLKRAYLPISGDAKVAREGNPDGPMSGHVVVFTGALRIVRREAAVLASRLGCTVADTVTSKTTVLVVGDEDIRTLGTQTKSGKHRKAEALISQGVPLRIIAESDFFRIVAAEQRT